MHSTSFNSEPSNSKGGDVLVSVATLVTESRIPGSATTKSKKFYEGPHCTLIKSAEKEHQCNLADSLCMKFENDREKVLDLCQKNIPLCIEVLLTCECKEINTATDNLDNIYVLEQWHFNISAKRTVDPLFFNLNQLVSAIRSQLYFSQITAWLSTQEETSTLKITEENFRYHLTIPGKTFTTPKFYLSASKHDFPLTDIGNGLTLNVSFYSLPRTSTIPEINCANCLNGQMELNNGILVDDRMHTSCKLKGKHRCEDFEEEENIKLAAKLNIKRLCQNNKSCEASTSSCKPKMKYIENWAFAGCDKRNLSPNRQQAKLKSAKLELPENDLKKDMGQLLLDAIERSGQRSTKESASKGESDINCDKSESDIFSIKQKNNFNIYVDKHCDSPIPKVKQKKIRDISNLDVPKRSHISKKITFDEFDDDCPLTDETPLFSITRQKITIDDSRSNNVCDKDGKSVEVPSQSEQAKFRKNLDSAASMVFHSRTGLPLTSSPAPVRRGKSCFDFDSTINSVSAIKSALFSASFSTDDDSESDGSIVSPCSPETYELLRKHDEGSPIKYYRKGHANNLLGSFEESVLNGRLEPVSTVHGFTAELGASGSFVPKHLVVPVTVFFYTLGDNDKVSSPYLSHINLGKKGYLVPRVGTVQVTLFNPLGTVVKMFVIMYDLTDMPPNSQTFIRQRTLYMPTNCKEPGLEWGPKWLRYLIHLRFMSSKSGKVYLHSDIRMIIFRKCDMDTATAHGLDMSYELRSFTHMPTNPKFSPRK